MTERRVRMRCQGFSVTGGESDGRVVSGGTKESFVRRR